MASLLLLLLLLLPRAVVVRYCPDIRPRLLARTVLRQRVEQNLPLPVTFGRVTVSLRADKRNLLSGLTLQAFKSRIDVILVQFSKIVAMVGPVPTL